MNGDVEGYHGTAAGGRKVCDEACCGSVITQCGGRQVRGFAVASGFTHSIVSTPVYDGDAYCRIDVHHVTKGVAQ